MIDTVALFMMVLLLALAPADQKPFAIDGLDPEGGRVRTILVTRTAEGFSLLEKDLPGSSPSEQVQVRKGKDDVWQVTLPGEKKPFEIKLGPILKELESLATRREQQVTWEETKVTVALRGDTRYVFHKSSVFVGRPAELVGPPPLRGTLVFKKLPETMSVEAYLGREFVLKREDGADAVLLPSDAVSRDRLEKANGKKVEVRVVRVEDAEPDPGSAAPMGPDGKPLKRGGGWRVLELTLLDQ